MVGIQDRLSTCILRSNNSLLVALLLHFILSLFHPTPSWAEDFDWRNIDDQNFVTPVKNQNPAGTCWAFAPVGALEAKCKITRNDPAFNPNMSEQNLVCAGGMGNINSGYATKALNYFTSTGIVSETELKYTAQNTSTQWPLQSGWENRVWKSTSNKNTITATTTNYKNKLKANGPLVSLLSDNNDLFSSVSKLYSHYKAPTSDTNHFVMVVGFHDDPSVSFGGYWIVKNSWGTGWGDAGYGYVAYGNLEFHNGTDMINGAVYYTGSMDSATWKGNTNDVWNIDSGTSNNWSESGSA